MKQTTLGLMLLILMCLSTSATTNQSHIVKLNEQDQFIVQVSVTGERGTLTFPALIDTGANRSFIPRSVADGIGFKSEKTETCSTAAGEKQFKVITVKTLSFLGIEFCDVDVAVTDPDPNSIKQDTPSGYFDQSFFSSQANQSKSSTYSNSYPKPSQAKELAIIGMSELSRVKLHYENGILTISPQ